MKLGFCKSRVILKDWAHAYVFLSKAQGFPASQLGNSLSYQLLNSVCNMYWTALKIYLHTRDVTKDTLGGKYFI